eukprot:jgi/Ulvmu1/11823/UM080_0034.1
MGQVGPVRVCSCDLEGSPLNMCMFGLSRQLVQHGIPLSSSYQAFAFTTALKFCFCASARSRSRQEWIAGGKGTSVAAIVVNSSLLSYHFTSTKWHWSDVTCTIKLLILDLIHLVLLALRHSLLSVLVLDASTDHTVHRQHTHSPSMAMPRSAGTTLECSNET